MTAATLKFGGRPWPGASVLRKEDRAFITGAGRYTDDISLPGMLHGHVLRSPHANAGFAIHSVAAALAMPGVHLVLTGADVASLGALRSKAMQRQPDGSRAPTRDIPILCRDQARYVGDALAFVVADSAERAEDAAEAIDIEFNMLDAIAETASALEDGAALVWPETGSNLAFTYRLGDKDATDAAFAKAARVTRFALRNNRLVANYMETRAAIGDYSPGDGRFTLTCGSQGVHSVRDILCGQVFGMPGEKLRVITPDVGGGFGPKSFTYREYALVLEAARRLERPVKWTATRTEHFLTDAQGRDNETRAEMAMDEDGRFLAMRVELTAAMGAYISQFGPYIPYMGATMTTGVYGIAAMDVSISGVYTNTCPVDAYRGAGRPEAAFLIERLADACARDMGLSPAEIRRRNFIAPGALPWRTPGGRMYDVGEFDGHLSQALDRADWQHFDARHAASHASGKLRGIGLASYIEACAFAGSEPAFVRLENDGSVTLDIGTQSNGQGHATAYAQFAAEKLALPIEKINVVQGDTDRLESGGGTGGSRSIPLGGVSAARAGEDLAIKIRRIAADELEAAPEDIELENGEARIAGTDRHLSYSAVAHAAKTLEDRQGFGEFVQSEATYPNGTHVCEVEIDPETGQVRLVSYVAVDDFGVTVNQLLLDGQVHGGIAQGVGQALCENAVYGEDGQLLTASFMDYAMPRADLFPDLVLETRNVPSTTNALGIKGAGEAGTIGAAPAVMNAISDALWRAGYRGRIDMPATSEHIWRALQAASV